MTQQGDVLLRHTPDGGEVSFERGLIAMSGGLETSVYISLFGGNQRDPGDRSSAYTWWGNLSEEDPARQVRSRTQHILDGIAAIPDNLRRVEDAVRLDLGWMTRIGAASQIEVQATMPAPKRVRILVRIDGNETLEFVENWRASSGD